MESFSPHLADNNICEWLVMVRSFNEWKVGEKTAISLLDVYVNIAFVCPSKIHKGRLLHIEIDKNVT